MVCYIEVLLYINDKFKHKESVDWLKENKEAYEDPKEICEVLNKKFQKVFTTESEFEKLARQEKNEMWEIKINRDK